LYIREPISTALSEPVDAGVGALLGKPPISLRKTDRVRTSVERHGASRAALDKATTLMNEVFESLAPANVSRFGGTRVRLHIIPHDKKLTDLADFKEKRGGTTPDKRSYDSLRATGGMRSGSSIVYAVGEETIVSSPGPPSYYHLGYLVSRESGLVIARLALTSDQKRRLQKLFKERAANIWLGTGRRSSPEEYLAESTAAFFGHPERNMVPYLARFTRAWLQQNDLPMHALLSEIYAGATGV
jgi:hypothetical protein